MGINIEIDCSEDLGGKQYKYIAEKSVEDLGLGGSIEYMRMFIRMEEPVFIISIGFREFVGKNTLGELAMIDTRSGRLRVLLESEIYLGDALKTLWTAYGRDRVEQVGRVEIDIIGADQEEVKKLKIAEKAIDVEGRVNELASRIIPEGFRVRSHSRKKGVMTVIASEDPIKPEWRQIASRLEGKE